MSNQLKIKARFMTKLAKQYRDLEIDHPASNEYILKDVIIHKNNILWIEPYEGVCLLQFAGDTQLITNIPIEDCNIFGN